MIKDIKTWIAELLKDIENPVIVEIGSNEGMDTVELAAIPGSTVHAFEPDRRCELTGMPLNRILREKVFLTFRIRQGIIRRGNFGLILLRCSVRKTILPFTLMLSLSRR
jgi:hypothetical protein